MSYNELLIKSMAPDSQFTKHNIGPCFIFIDDVNIGPTLASTETSFVISPNSEKVYTDESEDLKYVLKKGANISAQFSTLITSAIEKAIPADTITVAELRIVSMYSNLLIRIPKAIITPKYTYNFKKDKLSSVTFTVEAMNDKNKKRYYLETKEEQTIILGGVNVDYGK